MEINPRDWHNTRYIDYAPKHFIKFVIKDINFDRLTLLNWLEVNTIGRYSIESNLKNNNSRIFISTGVSIAFEEPSDATMYSLFFK